MEPFEHNEIPATEPKLILTEEAQYYLQKSGQWAYFLGIVGFVLTGLFVLMALFIGSFMAAMARFSPTGAGMPAGTGGLFSFFYILIAVFYFFFSLYIYQFGDKIKKGIVYGNAIDVTAALGKLKSFFKLWGITTIVIVGFYALIFVIVIVAGVGAASMMK
ncbi:hypothetical protein FPZ43_10945 [Mucilaginibacter pallidiroseus]|uniref:DUF5362 domain-containing protein n=1 Tax=Mucilaginibacter pallidiroseus TaxID=2599295 RepID=A0A563UDM0_9SPHI|nr:DUF5362 family protein [Mucilaginibacter pallidiroseus]TWR29458.1 hypothetical protein FPZ43_10945 [Mucilaginibacter pallidiroseus]